MNASRPALRAALRPAPRIVLVRPKAAENVGAAARAMKNFGVSEMVLVAPRCRLDRNAYALASHAGDVLDEARTVHTLVDALEGCTFALATAGRDRSVERTPTVTATQGVRLLPADGSSAIVFGPEDHGLSNEHLDHCQAVVTIPTADYPSVNLAQAVNIVCYAWFVAGEEGDVTPAEHDVATRDQYEQMYRQLRETMLVIGYTDANRLESIERMYRGFLDRARLDPRELAALRGLWSQARWAAEQDPKALPGRRDKR